MSSLYLTCVSSTFVDDMMAYRNHIALMLCAVISLNVLAVPISYLNFKIHQDYYATVLCKNPDKPITVCGGVCYLKKQLPESSDGTPATFLSKIDISVYYQQFHKWEAVCLSRHDQRFTSSHQVSYRSSHISQLFRPPQG